MFNSSPAGCSNEINGLPLYCGAARQDASPADARSGSVPVSDEILCPCVKRREWTPGCADDLAESGNTSDLRACNALVIVIVLGDSVAGACDIARREHSYHLGHRPLSIGGHIASLLA